MWKSVVGLEGYYEVSDDGQVRTVERIAYRNQKIKGSIRKTTYMRGYQRVTLRKDGNLFCKQVHRLVAEAFIPNPLGLPCVNHKNSIRDDNRVENIEWCSVAENNQHAWDFGGKRKSANASAAGSMNSLAL